MIVTAPFPPIPETLPAPGPPMLFEVPPPFFDMSPQGSFTRRLPPQLRAAAKICGDVGPAHPLALPMAAYEFYAATMHLPGHSFDTANALTDLAVTGHKAWAKFSAAKLDLAAAMKLPCAVPDGPMRTIAWTRVLDRAYDVAWALRGPPEVRKTLRGTLNWIAVSGEDDAPHRPVNVASSPFPQFDLPFTMPTPLSGKSPTLAVKTRFFIASKRSAPGPARTVRWSLPEELAPVVPAGDRVVLFLHGDSSNCEESLELAQKLLDAGEAKGIPLCAIALDLPNCGYGERFDHLSVAMSDTTRHAPAITTPLLDFVEDYFVAFVHALDKKTPILDRIIGVAGGSLGGSLGLRLGRRNFADEPWLGTMVPKPGSMSPNPGIVAFSPASVWDNLSNSATWLALTDGPGRPLASLRDHWSEAPPGTEEPRDMRHEFFYSVFDQPLLAVDGAVAGGAVGAAAAVAGSVSFGVGAALVGLGAAIGAATGPVILLPAQPATWYGKAFKYRNQLIAWARASQHEVYDACFRRWHWRMCFEQVCFSHWHNAPDGKPLYLKNIGRTLLLAGDQDDFTGAQIYSNTKNLAPKMALDRGKALFLLGTGHSIPAEAPAYMISEMVKFLLDDAGIGKAPPLTVVTGPVLGTAVLFVPPPNEYATWHTTRVAFDSPATGGVEGNASVQGTFDGTRSGLFYVARDLRQVELTTGKPAHLSVLTAGDLRQLSATFTREIAGKSACAQALLTVRASVDAIAGKA